MRKTILGEILDVKRGASLSGDYYAEEGNISFVCPTGSPHISCIRYGEAISKFFFVFFLVIIVVQS